MLQCSSFEASYSSDHQTVLAQNNVTEEEIVDQHTVEVMQGQTVIPSLEQGLLETPHPAMLGLPLTQASMVLAGYRDCAAEAVRYLIEDEHMSPEDPFVMGLRNHLYECQKRLDLHNILRHYDMMMMTQSVNHVSEDSLSLDDSGISDTNVTDNHGVSVSQESNCVQNQNSDSNMTSQSLDMESLQNNNPAISALAEELFMLLEEEDQGMSDVDSEEEIAEQ